MATYIYIYIYMQMNYLPAGGTGRDRSGAGEIEVSPITLYTKQSSTHKCCFIRHYMQYEMKQFLNTVGFLQKYSDIKTPALGFRLKLSQVKLVDFFIYLSWPLTTIKLDYWTASILYSQYSISQKWVDLTHFCKYFIITFHVTKLKKLHFATI